MTNIVNDTFFKKRCIVNIKTNCWEWQGYVNKQGYGTMSYHGTSGKLVHRVVYKAIIGDIPDNLIIRHKCDNKKCCNPDHLEIGTQKDNANDRQTRSNIVTSKLTIQVRKLKTIKERINFYLTYTVKNNDCFISNILTPVNGGYYRVSFQLKNYYLHRLILADKLNKEYADIDVTRHICNNKSCINPEHLIEGSAKDNALDYEKTKVK